MSSPRKASTESQPRKPAEPRPSQVPEVPNDGLMALRQALGDRRRTVPDVTCDRVKMKLQQLGLTSCEDRLTPAGAQLGRGEMAQHLWPCGLCRRAVHLKTTTPPEHPATCRRCIASAKSQPRRKWTTGDLNGAYNNASKAERKATLRARIKETEA